MTVDISTLTTLIFMDKDLHTNMPWKIGEDKRAAVSRGKRALRSSSTYNDTTMNWLIEKFIAIRDTTDGHPKETYTPSLRSLINNL